MSDDARRVTNWLSLRRTPRGCLVQMTVAVGEASFSIHRALTTPQLNQLIAAARQVASKLPKAETEEVRDAD